MKYQSSAQGPPLPTHPGAIPPPLVSLILCVCGRKIKEEEEKDWPGLMISIILSMENKGRKRKLWHNLCFPLEGQTDPD